MFLHRSFNYDYACANKTTTSISLIAKAEAVSSSALAEGASIEDQRNRWPGYPDTCVDRQLTGVKTAESRAPGRRPNGDCDQSGKWARPADVCVKSDQQALTYPQIFAFDS